PVRPPGADQRVSCQHLHREGLHEQSGYRAEHCRRLHEGSLSPRVVTVNIEEPRRGSSQCQHRRIITVTCETHCWTRPNRSSTPISAAASACVSSPEKPG